MHDALDFVGVYYMKVPKNSGYIQLMNPDITELVIYFILIERDNI